MAKNTLKKGDIIKCVNPFWATPKDFLCEIIDVESRNIKPEYRLVTVWPTVFEGEGVFYAKRFVLATDEETFLYFTHGSKALILEGNK